MTEHLTTSQLTSQRNIPFRDRAGDVRVHDTAQAGELEHRLGARATVGGRELYVQSQSAGPPMPPSRLGGQSSANLPLAARLSEVSSQSPQGRTVQRDKDTSAGTPAPPTRTEEPVLRTSPASQSVRLPGGSYHSPDPEELADRVYALIVKELLLDEERRAHCW